MSDLRTRIAAAIEGEVDHLVPRSDIELAADAVIRELGLRQEAAFDSKTDRLIGHRYVTAWISDTPTPETTPV
jgi:hypothetical protein